MHAWSWLEFLGERVVASSWQATWLIGVVLVLQRLLRRRLSPRWRHALWLPVVVRLALPVTPPSSFSAFQWLPGGGSSPSGVEGAVNGTPPTDSSPPIRWWKDAAAWAGEQDQRDAVGDQLPASPPAPAEGKRVASVAMPTTASPTAAIAPETAASPALTAASASATGDPGRGNEMGLPVWIGGSWTRGLTVVWVGGILLWLAIVAAAFARCHARVRRCPPVRHPGLLRLWAECQAALGVDREVQLVESTIASGPALFGFRRLWLLLPPGFAGRFTVEQQRHVFLHELAHLRRRDVASHWALALIQAVHWFNPVVWLAFARVRAAREGAADALALEAVSQEEARNYGLTVLQLVEACSGPSRLPGLVGILDGPGRLEERIDSIVRFRPGTKASRWPIVLLGLLVLGGLTDAPRSAAVVEKAPSAVAPGATLAGAEGGGTAGRVFTNGPAVRVKVVDDATGQPLAGAEVVTPSKFFTAGQGRGKSSAWFTDSSGEVTIYLGLRDASQASEEWLISITARRSGFAPRGRRWLIPRGVSDYRVPEAAEFRLRRGRTVGGVFRDETGRPLAGIRVRVMASDYQVGPPGEEEYSEFWQRGDDAVFTVSDAQGRWLVADFPADLNRAQIECVRPDGMVHRFEGGPTDPSDEAIHLEEWGAPMDVEAFLAQKAELVLPSGHTLRGRVVDTDGRPVAGARVRAAFGHDPQTSAGETRSDALGRFAFPHRSPVEWILTAEAPGFAITSVVVPIGEAEGLEHDIRLNPPNPVRLKAVDTSGKPLANVVVAVDPTRSGPQVLDYSGLTDGEGTLVWTNAPLGGLTFRLQNPADNLERWVRLTPSEREELVRVRPGKVDAVVVSGRCAEAGTDRPIEIATVGYRDPWSMTFSTVALENFESLGQGRFRLEVPLEWFRPGLPRLFQLRLWAPGVGRVITELRDFDEGDWELTVPFRRGGALQGTIRLPDGRPAADAVVAAPLSASYVTFTDRGFFRDGEDLIQGQADGSGRYGVDDPGGDAAFVFQHPQGFLEIPASRLRENGDVTLVPYGRVEGVFRSSQVPLAGATVTIRRDVYGRSGVGWSLFRGTVSAADGAFVFTNLPSGTYILSRSFTPAGGSLWESHPMRVRVESGSTTRVTYGGDGRAVVGRVTTPALHWEAIGHRLVAQPTMEQPRRPDPNRFATRERYIGWSKTNDRVNEWFYQRRVYGVMVQRDGTFRVEDVPAGVYELELIPHDPRLDASANPPLAALVNPREGRRLRHRVVMPPVTDADRGVPLDLGVLEFPTEAKGPVSGR